MDTLSVIVGIVIGAAAGWYAGLNFGLKPSFAFIECPHCAEPVRSGAIVCHHCHQKVV